MLRPVPLTMKTLTVLFAILVGFVPEARSATLLYALTRNGQLYSSANGAKTWQPIQITGAPSPALQDGIVIDPQNPSILYVGVSGDGKGPVGLIHDIFRSTDGGATWSQSNEPHIGNGGIANLHIDPSSSNILYFGGSPGGFFRSTDSAATWSAATLTEPITGIGTDAHQPGVVYAGTETGKVYRSADFGVTWTLLTSNPGFTPTGHIFDIAVDPKNSNVLYAPTNGSCQATTKPFLGFQCGLFQSADGGKTWQVVSALTGAFKNVVIDPRNGNIYAGGGAGTAVARSTDGGKTWTQTASGMSKFPAVVQLDPEVATSLYAWQGDINGDALTGPGGGVYVSTNSGASWTLSPVAPLGNNDVVLSLAVVSTSVVPPPASGPSISAVVSAAAYGGFSAVAPGSWVEIYGSNLAPDTRQWAGGDFNGNSAPTSLDGVTVNIGGQLAFIDYISSGPGQINAQLPSNIATGGTLQVTVTNDSVTSPPFNITANPTKPGLLAPAAFQIGGKQYVVALLPDGTYVLPPGSIAGLASRQAKPGETIVMYGIGFGSTAPDFPAGQIVTANNQLALPLQLLFGQTPAQLSYDGLAPGYVGLYQFDVVVPGVASSDLVPLTFNLGGVAGTQTLYIAVHQ
jgi:uncharacterized protein (TIGR03437 family)